jgi:hypothetical protein
VTKEEVIRYLETAEEAWAAGGIGKIAGIPSPSMRCMSGSDPAMNWQAIVSSPRRCLP